MCSVAPASRDRLSDNLSEEVLRLAPSLEQLWPGLEAQAASQGLVAMAEENEETATAVEDPTPPETDPEAKATDNETGDGEVPSFLDEYDLGEVPEEGREAVEAHIKRISGAYTRQRQQDTQAIRDAKQHEEIVQGLLNPQTQASVAQALGLPLGQEYEDALYEDDEFGVDPAVQEQLDAMRGELSQRDELAAAAEAEQAENLQIAEGLEQIERQTGTELTDEEVDVLTALAEEHPDENGVPDVQAGFRALDAIVAGRIQGMRTRKPPRRTGSGGPGNPKVDLNDPDQQMEAMEAAVAAARASGE